MLSSAAVKSDARSIVTARIAGVARGAASLARVSALVLAMSAAGCHGRDDAANRAAVANLDQALGPTFLAAALRKLGGGHFHATTRMSVTAAATTTNEAGWDTVTTTTDLWLDRKGNYRILENNDQDGGREIVLFGRELNVALRYGKMIRRVAQDPEPQRLLEEALGGPWAGWQMAAPFANIEHHPVDLGAGHKGEEYNVSKSPRRNRKVVSPVQRGMKEWRNTATVLELTGRMTVDAASGALLKSDLVVVFAAHRPSDAEESPTAPPSEPEPIVGTVESQTTLEQAGKTAPIERPVAEDLAVRQRLVPEQKDLLSGLSAPRGAGQEGGGGGKP
jgi:hypothetical protein